MREDPFRILLIGDFSGRGSRQGSPAGAALGDRRPISVDRDNFDRVLSHLRPTLEVGVQGGESFEIPFADLDEFHPDSLLDRVPIFEDLRDLRVQLEDPSTFHKAAGQLQPEAPKPAPAAPAAETLASSGNLLDSILSQAEEEPAARPKDGLQQFIDQVVAPHAEPRADPRQPEMIAKADQTIGDAMRGLLHYPPYQALEALWRAVFLLTRRIETSVDLKLYLLDASRAEIETDVLGREDLSESALYKTLVESTVGTPGAPQWSLLASDLSFSGSEDDVKLLAMLGGLARAAKAPLLANAEPGVYGCDSAADLSDAARWSDQPGEWWSALRSFPEAPWIGLTAPRFLLRSPYGADSDPCDTFQFEEIEGEAMPGDFLWGPGAFFAACVAAANFTAQGWNMQLRGGDLDRLPLYSYTADGEDKLQPPAEALLTERGIERMLDCGVMSLVALKNTDTVRLLRFQSIAEPAQGLAGTWG